MNTPSDYHLRRAANRGTIQCLNDKLRIEGRGGLIILTDRFALVDRQTVRRVFDAIAAFDEFTPDSDPYGEHDFGCLTVGEHGVFWKIDYYVRSRTALSPDPANKKLTMRVMTVALHATIEQLATGRQGGSGLGLASVHPTPGTLTCRNIFLMMVPPMVSLMQLHDRGEMTNRG